MKKRRRELDADTVREMSAQIRRRLFECPEWKNAGNIMTYIAAFGEPETLPIIERAQELGYEVSVPVTGVDIPPCVIESASELSAGAYGIPEPVKIIPADAGKLDFIIVPGLVFSRSGARAGFGKGYYDRFLPRTSAVKCALCYDFQLSADLKPQPWDVPMDIIITEKELIYCGNAAKML